MQGIDGRLVQCLNRRILALQGSRNPLLSLAQTIFWRRASARGKTDSFLTESDGKVNKVFGRKSVLSLWTKKEGRTTV